MKNVETKFVIGDTFYDAKHATVGEILCYKVHSICFLMNEGKPIRTYKTKLGMSFTEEETMTLEEAVKMAKIYHECKIQELDLLITEKEEAEYLYQVAESEEELDSQEGD